MDAISYIRLTLAEAVALAPNALTRYGKVTHLVLTEKQEKLPTADVFVRCAIVSVEDDAGITIAVLKHRTGETWDRRVKAAESPALKVADGYLYAIDEHAPVVPRHPITISDEVKFKQAKRAMKMLLLRGRERYESLSFLGAYDDKKGDDQVDTWDDIINVEGIIDIDALVRTFWRVMKG